MSRKLAILASYLLKLIQSNSNYIAESFHNKSASKTYVNYMYKTYMISYYDYGNEKSLIFLSSIIQTITSEEN